MRAVLSYVVFVICFSAFWAKAQATSGDPWSLSQWQRKIWQIEDGLPHNYVTAVVQDTKGRLLIGTKDGIVRFDGFTFSRYPQMEDNWIYSLLVEPDGTLWVGTYEHGLYRVRNHRAVKVANGSFYMLNRSADGQIVAVSDLGFGFVENDQFQLVIPGENTEGYGWQSASQDEDGTFWFAAKTGLYRMRAGIPVRAQVLGLRGVPVTVYSLTQPHRLFVGTTSGLYQLSCNQSSCRAVHMKNVHGPVVGIRETSDRSLWVGTWGQGLYRQSTVNGETRVEHMDHTNGLADDFVHAIYEDTEHNLWIGTRGGGLTRFRTTVLKPVGIPEGVNGNCASAALGDNEGNVWLSTWRSGLFRWRNHSAKQMLPSGLSTILINSLALDSSHNLWIGSFDGLYELKHSDGTTQKITRTVDLSKDETVRHVLAAFDGSLWVVVEGHLIVFPSGNPKTSRGRVILSQEHVTDILQSHSGILWIGTTSGLWQMTTSHSVPVLQFSYPSPVLSISEDHRLRLWTTYEDGSILVDNGNRFVSFPDSTFPNKLIYKVIEDAGHNFWFSTGLGLVRVSGHDADSALSNPTIRIDAVPFGISDGARTIECRCADYPQSWTTPNGVMWIPTAKGFVEADPRRVGSMPPPIVSIGGIYWDKDRVVEKTSATLQAGAHALEIHFTAIRLGAPQQVRFRYRMEGIDRNWINSGRERTARYAELPPGHYRFLVSARDAIGGWSPSAEVTIDQRPYVYQTIWFKVLMIMLAVLLMTVLYLTHLRSVRARYAAVLDERIRIAREWHDTLLAGLAAVSLQLDVAIRNCAHSALLPNLKSIQGMLRYCSDEARRAVSYLRSETLSPPDLASVVSTTLEQATAGTAVQSELHVASGLPPVASEVSLHLSRICQEALSNAIQHGRPAKVMVALDYIDEAIILCVQDNGCGIDPSVALKPPPGHFGILGMRERMERLGGQLEISSAGDCGTLISARVPIVK